MLWIVEIGSIDIMNLRLNFEGSDWINFRIGSILENVVNRIGVLVDCRIYWIDSEPKVSYNAVDVIEKAWHV